MWSLSGLDPIACWALTSCARVRDNEKERKKMQDYTCSFAKFSTSPLQIAHVAPERDG